jgi:hypothetical protein
MLNGSGMAATHPSRNDAIEQKETKAFTAAISKFLWGYSLPPNG